MCSTLKHLASPKVPSSKTQARCSGPRSQNLPYAQLGTVLPVPSGPPPPAKSELENHPLPAPWKRGFMLGFSTPPPHLPSTDLLSLPELTSLCNSEQPPPPAH